MTSDDTVQHCITDHVMNGARAEKSWQQLLEMAREGHAKAKEYVDKIRAERRQNFELV